LRFDRFHDHDGVIDHDADRQHQRQQRNGVGRIAQRQHHAEGADQRYRNGQQRNQRGADIAEEQKDDDDDKDESLAQRMQHALDAFADEHRGVVGDPVVDPFRKRKLELLENLSDLLSAVERVTARRLVDPEHRRRLAVEPPDRFRQPSGELDAGNIANAHERPVGVGAHHDGAELLRARQPALALDVKLELLIGQRRLRADASNRGLDVLRLQRVGDVAWNQAVAGEAIGVEPHLHAVIGGRKQRDVADAGHALELVDNVDGRIIAEEELIIPPVRRGHCDDLQQRRRLLGHADTLRAYISGKLGLGKTAAVLYLNSI